MEEIHSPAKRKEGELLVRSYRSWRNIHSACGLAFFAIGAIENYRNGFDSGLIGYATGTLLLGLGVYNGVKTRQALNIYNLKSREVL